MNEATLELNEKTDLLAIETECPVCGDKYMHGVPYVHVPCNKCGTSYKTDLKQDIYTKIARRIEQILAWHDKLTITATEKYYQQLLHIEDNFKRFKNWDVSEKEQAKESYRFCLNCGICNNCLTCMDCGTAFERDQNRRKQRCPKCKSTNFRKTRFKDAIQSKNKKACPHCKSEKIQMTRTTRKTKCHNCGSTKLTDMRTNILYKLIIERKGGYRI